MLDKWEICWNCGFFKGLQYLSKERSAGEYKKICKDCKEKEQ